MGSRTKKKMESAATQLMANSNWCFSYLAAIR